MASVTNDSRHKRITVSNDVDRISNLPESIISHILSLLPTEDAVATSFVSKKWKLLWRDIHNLSFDDSARYFRKHQHTIQEQDSLFSFFVNKVLFYLDRKCIDKFSLHIEQFSEEHYVTFWIDIAVSRNPRVIHFDARRYPEYYVLFDMPRSLFTCETLEVLHLNAEITLNVPNLVSLPNLKTLRVGYVNYDMIKGLLKLISGCSSLETLYVKRVGDDNVGHFTISSPTLRNFTLDFTYDQYIGGFKLAVNAPQLRYLELSNKYLLEDFSLENLCLLDEAKLKLDLYHDSLIYQFDSYSEAVVRLFQGIYNVQKLSLMGDELEALSHVDFSPIFLRLSHLTIPPICWTQSLLNILESSKKIESLTILKDDYDYDYEIRTPWTRWSEPEKLPINLFSCLKTVSFKGIEGLADELAIVAYILENAKLLRTITIQPYSFLDIKARFKLLQKISKFPRGSVKCELQFL